MAKKPTGRGGGGRGAGRKGEALSGKTSRYNVSLDKETAVKARRIGKGDRSLGIRRAVKDYPDDKE